MNSFSPLVRRGINRVALLGTYMPRRCGIATFTKDLHDGLAQMLDQRQTMVLAMDDGVAEYEYPEEVRFQLSMHLPDDYSTAADMLNINQVELTIVQHEYGIFGGTDGALLLGLLQRLKMPTIVTLHTVLEHPSDGQRAMVRDIASLADRLVVMSSRGVQFLHDSYAIPPHKVVCIPHGIPDVPFVDSSFFKDQFGLDNCTSLLTFGLLSPGKGIETMLEALPAVVQRHPDVRYIILGATHPHVLRHEGEAYRTLLAQQVDRLQLHDFVQFHNRFVSLEELCAYIGAADLYMTPYPHKAQITSGTLAYACSAGKAVVSTPYWYAEEMLAEGRGCLVPFNDSAALAHTVLDLLEKPAERNAMRKRSYLYCRNMVWREVARAYLDVAMQVVEDRNRKPLPRPSSPVKLIPTSTLPEISLRHLQTLTDDTGLFQHALHTIPDRDHGYCTDDNARALLAVLRYYSLRRDTDALPLINTYLAFLFSAFDQHSGRFRNFMDYGRHWLDDGGSEDCHGRALWALGEAVSLIPDTGIAGLATEMFIAALPLTEHFSAPRAWASSVVGIHAYLREYSGDTQTRRMRSLLAHRLYALFEQVARPQWPWCEDVVTYDNGMLALALLLSGKWLPHEGMLQQGLRSLEWLLDVQTNAKGEISLIGCHGWYRRNGRKAHFDQQPLEIMGLVEACAEAFRLTRDHRWIDAARRCMGWFLGRNDLNEPLYDFKSGGCHDGLTPGGANRNEGAESVVSWLVTLVRMYDLAAMESTDTGRAVESVSRPMAGN